MGSPKLSRDTSQPFRPQPLDDAREDQCWHRSPGSRFYYAHSRRAAEYGGLRHSLAGSSRHPAESGSLVLRTGCSCSVALHPASWRRSYFQLLASNTLPGKDLNLPGIPPSLAPERRFLTAVVRPWSWHMYCLFPSNIRLRRDGDKEIAAPFVTHPGIWNWGFNKFHYWFLLRSDLLDTKGKLAGLGKGRHGGTAPTFLRFPIN